MIPASSETSAGKPAGAVPSAADLRRAIAAGAEVLAESQEADGGFPLAPVLSEPLGSAGDSLFSTATVLALAAPVLPAACVSRAAGYLAERRDGRGLWAWAADGTLPADADDTALCLGALARTGVPLDRRQGARLLRKFWRWGGPFRTWLASGGWNGRDRDDPVVNCNVLWALGELGAPIRTAERRTVAAMVAAQRGPTRYYCSEASLAWAAARVGIPAPRLRPPHDAALARQPLECALWALAAPTPKVGTAALLLEAREPDGGWAAEPWVRGQPGVWESRAVTIAAAIAALLRLAPCD
jgi:hypothetical protein